jgi:hypothetical protein
MTVYELRTRSDTANASVNPAVKRGDERRALVRLTGIRVLSVALVVFAAPMVFAQSPPWDDPQWVAEKGMDERFGLNLGGFFQKFKTTLDVGPSSGGEGSNIDLERDLGLGSQTAFRADGYWRFGRHGRFDFGYAGWTRSNTHTLERTIDIGDHEYSIGASVNFRQHTDVFNMYYGYSFVYTPKVEFGLRLGVSATYNDFSLSGSATAIGPGGGGTVENVREPKKFWAPIPTVGAYISATLIPRLFVTGGVKWLPKITASNYSVEYVDGRGGLEFFFTKNFGLGADYNYIKLDFSRNTTRQYALHYRYDGPYGYLALAF